jgi:signal transduction histidine kinase
MLYIDYSGGKLPMNRLIKHRQSRHLRILYGLVALTIGLFLFVSIWSLEYAYKQADTQVSMETLNLARSLVLSIDGLIDTIDVTLQESVNEISQQLASGSPNEVAINRFLYKQTKLVPSLNTVCATNPQGKIVYGLDPDKVSGSNISVTDRDYFNIWRNHPDFGLFNSKPIVSRVSNKPIWLFSRGIRKPDGSFAGVVTASIWTENLQKILASIKLPPESSISLRHSSLELIVRANFDSADVIPVGSKVISIPLSRALMKDPRQGVYISDTSGLDKVIKTYAYQLSQKYGYRIIVAIPRDVALAAWYKQVAIVSALTLLSIAGAAVFVIFLRRAWHRQDQDLEIIQMSRDALQSLNNELEERVNLRTSELSATLDHLRATQDELIESEKLASLGSMVAGVSHEINTPIGNAVTLTSTLDGYLKELEKKMLCGAMTRSGMQTWIISAIEINQLMEKSVNRVSELVRSFKQVAIDRTSERRRIFDLRQAIEETLLAQRHITNGLPWKIENLVSEGILCDSYPGSFEQIVTNLIQNAILHAFDGRERGVLIISAEVDSGKIRIHFADDGKGMDATTLPRIFEPFFTTKLGRGGSGLGLAICHRIATNVLAGDLIAESIVNLGSLFTLIMPQQAPGQL